VRQFRSQVLSQLDACCRDVISLLDEKLFPPADEPGARLFRCNMRGVCCRYNCDNQDGAPKAEWTTAATDSYKKH
jgi:hypothetical protein